MKLNPKKVRFISSMTPGLFVRGLRFVGRENTVQLQETALVVEGNLLKVGLLGIELIYRRALAEWSSITIPYSRITRVRFIRFPLRRRLALLFLAIALVSSVYLWTAVDDEPPVIKTLAESLIVMLGVIPGVIALVVLVMVRSRHAIDFRAQDGRRTRLQLAIDGKSLRTRFTSKLKEYRALAKKFGKADLKGTRGGPGIGILAALTAALLFIAGGLGYLGWKYVLPLVAMLAPQTPDNAPNNRNAPDRTPPRTFVPQTPNRNAPGVTPPRRNAPLSPLPGMAGGKAEPFTFEPLADDANASPTQLKHPGMVQSLAWLADGRLATASVDGAVRVWDMRTGRGTAYTLDPAWKPVFLALMPDPDAPARVTVALIASNIICLWAVGKPDRPQELYRPQAFAFSGVFTPNHQRLAIGGGPLEVLDVKSRTSIGSIPISLLLRNLNISPGGDRVSAVDLNNTLIVWAVGEKSMLQLKGYLAAVFSPDGKTLAAQTTGNPSLTRLIDPVTGNTIRELEFSSGGGPLSFSPNGRVLATGFAKENIAGIGLWDPADGRLLSRISGTTISTGMSAFSPDGGMLATVSIQEVAVWRTPREVETIIRGKATSEAAPVEAPRPRLHLDAAPHPRPVLP